MNCLYTIPLCNFGFAIRHTICVTVRDFGKALLKTESSPIFFSYKLSKRKPLFEMAYCVKVLPEKHCKVQIYANTNERYLGEHIDERRYAIRNTE